MVTEKKKDVFPPSHLTTASNKAVINTRQGDSITFIQWGSTTITASTAGGKFGYYGSKTITFPNAFSTAPRCWANIDEAAGYWHAMCTSTTATSATITIGGDANSTKTVQWLAIGWQG